MSHRFLSVFTLLLSLLLALGSCNDSNDDAQPACPALPSAAEAGALDAQPALCDSQHGSGALGSWTLDEYGDPAWEVGTPPGDPRWGYPTSKGTSTDVWHMIGNDTTNAIIHLDGAVELFAYPLGPTWLNKRLDAYDQTAGGWAEITLGGETYRIGGGSDEKVVWGSNYVSIAAEIGAFEVRRTYYLDRNDPGLLVQTSIQNDGGEEIDLELRQPWDYNLLFQVMFPVASGAGLDLAWDSRMEMSKSFETEAVRHADGIEMISRLKEGVEDPGGYGALGANVFLRADRQLEVCVSMGAEGSCQPPGDDRVGFADGQSSYFLSLNEAISVGAGETANRVHRFGWGEWDPTDSFPDFASTREDHPPQRMTLHVPSQPWIARETAWHSEMLQALGLHNRRFDANLIDQGSAYLYTQGLSGAVRDYVITALGVLPVDPQRTRDMLRVGMNFTQPDGHIFYAMRGPSETTEALIHGDSTDLDLWLGWGIAEYVLATRDFDYLSVEESFYPPETAERASVLEHVRRAVVHLRDVTGVGEHGMIRVGTGDWSDGVVLFAPDMATVVEKGESGFNTGMAVYVLPRIAEAVRAADPALANECVRLAEVYAEALENSWLGDRYLRGWDGQGGAIGGTDRFFLESQLFPLLAGHGGPTRSLETAQAIQTHLDERSDIGAVLVYPPQGTGVAELLVPGWDVNGGIWPAMNMLLTAAYANADKEWAWASWMENTLATHAEAYPEIWFGVTSGPDSFNAPYSDHPGATYWHPATSMADFPYGNTNLHAGPLFAAFRIAGLTADEAGWIVDPAIPDPTWRLESAIATLAADESGMSGRFVNNNGAPVRFRIAIPEGRSLKSGPEGAIAEAEWVVFTIETGEEARWSLVWE